MATCKNCNRSGIFLSVNRYGLCNTCNQGMIIEAQSRLRVLNESMKLVETAKNLSTRIARCDLLIEQAQALLKYEQLGIPLTKPLLSEIIKTYSANKSKIVIDGLAQEARQAMEKSKLGTSASSKISPLSKVILKIHDHRKNLSDDKELDALEEDLRKSIQDIQLKAYLDDAKLAEFKGNKKKALDKYYEALYFLQHDDIEDALQDDAIQSIEAKIKELAPNNQ